MDVSGGTSTIPAVLAEAAAIREEARAWVESHSGGGKSAGDSKPTGDSKPAGGGDKATSGGSKAGKSKKAKKAATLAADTEARANPALFSAMRAAHPDFAQTYTMVFRFIVELDSYDERVFRRYLEGLNGAWSDRKAWLKSQTEYAVSLYQHEHPRVTFAALNAYRSRVAQSLETEDADFTEAAEFAKEEVERLKKEGEELRRRQMISRALAQLAEPLGVPPPALASAIGALRAARESGAADPAAAARQILSDDVEAQAALAAYMAKLE